MVHITTLAAILPSSLNLKRGNTSRQNFFWKGTGQLRKRNGNILIFFRKGKERFTDKHKPTTSAGKARVLGKKLTDDDDDDDRT